MIIRIIVGVMVVILAKCIVHIEHAFIYIDGQAIMAPDGCHIIGQPGKPKIVKLHARLRFKVCTTMTHIRSNVFDRIARQLAAEAQQYRTV